MQATKAKVVGPMATMLKHSSAATEEDPIPNALPADLPESTPHEPLSLADRASTTEHPPLPLCSGKIIVSDSHAFPFQVPPHANFPRVTGTFTSSAGGAPEAIEILIFDRQEYDDYTHGGAGTATFQDEASGGHVDFALSSTLSEPRQYYLVFHNPARGLRTVAAKFTVTFD